MHCPPSGSQKMLVCLSSPVGSAEWIPRIRLLFIAEDPRVFVERIKFALRWRESTEALILYHLSVDCMPKWDKAPVLDADLLRNIKKYALTAPRLELNR